MAEALPSQPHVFYQTNWQSWQAFLLCDKQTTSAEDVQRLRDVANQLGITTEVEWRLAVLRKQVDGPIKINQSEGFNNWSSFLNQGAEYLSFEELLPFTRSLGLRTQLDWRVWCKTNPKPDNIPYDLRGHYHDRFVAKMDEIHRRRPSFWRYIFTQIGF
jgi:hypothetical protein